MTAVATSSLRVGGLSVADRPGIMWSTTRSRARRRSASSSTKPRLSKDNRRSVVHGVVKAGPGRDQTVELGNRHANLGLEHPGQPPGCDRSVEVETAALIGTRGIHGIRRRKDDRVVVRHHPEVRHQPIGQQSKQASPVCEHAVTAAARRRAGCRRESRHGTIVGDK